MIPIPHVDKPGMIGRVGSILGNRNVNISGMLNSRQVAGGTSLMVILVDTPASDDVLGEIASVEGIKGVSMVNL